VDNKGVMPINRMNKRQNFEEETQLDPNKLQRIINERLRSQTNDDRMGKANRPKGQDYLSIRKPV
jgi:hypothetical protein